VPGEDASVPADEVPAVGDVPAGDVPAADVGPPKGAEPVVVPAAPGAPSLPVRGDRGVKSSHQGTPSADQV
jgi:hypothetical protein